MLYLSPRYPYADDGVLYPDPEEEMINEDWDDVYNDRYYEGIGGD